MSTKISTGLIEVIKAQAALIEELTEALDKAWTHGTPVPVTSAEAFAAREQPFVDKYAAKVEEYRGGIEAAFEAAANSPEGAWKDPAPPVGSPSPQADMVQEIANRVEPAPTPPATEEKPKRKRRTKAEIEADKLAEAQKVLEQQQAAAAPPQYDPAAAPPEPPQASGWAPSW